MSDDMNEYKYFILYKDKNTMGKNKFFALKTKVTIDWAFLKITYGGKKNNESSNYLRTFS